MIPEIGAGLHIESHHGFAIRDLQFAINFIPGIHLSSTLQLDC